MYVADGVLAKEGVGAGFICQDGSRSLHYLGIGKRETGRDVDDCMHFSPTHL